jgi:hypothetical protein
LLAIAAGELILNDGGCCAANRLAVLLGGGVGALAELAGLIAAAEVGRTAGAVSFGVEALRTHGLRATRTPRARSRRA